MEIFLCILKFINDNTGLTLLFSAIGYAINEFVKNKNAKKTLKYTLKLNNLNPLTFKKERELYSLLTKYNLDTANSEADCISNSNAIKTFIIDNDLLLGDKISEIGVEFADYILEGYTNGRDIIKESKMLKAYKKQFRFEGN